MSGAKSSRPALNRLMADAKARKFDCLLVWKLDRFGRSLVDCLNNIRELEESGIRFIAVTQNLDTDVKNPASRLLLHVLGAAAEFERALIRERTQAGQLRYQQDYDAGRVGKEVHSRSGRSLRPTAPGESLTGNRWPRSAARDFPTGHMQRSWDWGWGRSPGRYRRVPKDRSSGVEQEGGGSSRPARVLSENPFLPRTVSVR